MDDIPPFILRDGDARECAQAGLTPLDAVRLSVGNSEEAWVFSEGPDAIVFGGFAPHSVFATSAQVWMFGTNLAPKYAREITRIGRRAVSTLLSRFTHIDVTVSRDYPSGLAWVKFLSFHPYEYSGRWVTMRATKGQLSWES